MRIAVSSMGACCADARDGLDEGRGAAFRLFCGFGLGFLAGFAAAFADCGRSYGVIAAQRLILKAIAARVSRPASLTSPTCGCG